jgi:alpha-beta hydrolase superfamily lysophospholipase
MLSTYLLKQIAAHLAENGIASLRFDKRAAHVYASAWPKEEAALNDYFSWQSFVGDADAALTFLRTQSEVDPNRVGVLGHSEGGLIALQLAQTAKPWTLVLLGTPGRNMAVIVREQVSNALKRQGAPKNVYDDFLGHVDKATKQVIEKGSVPDDIPPGLAPLFNRSVVSILRSYFKLDPPALAASYAGPVLVVNGKFDNQVSAERDSPVLFKGLTSRKGGKQELVIVDGASHNFKKVGSLDEAGFEGPVQPGLLSAIVRWVKSLG